jgi:hypothetical protein
MSLAKRAAVWLSFLVLAPAASMASPCEFLDGRGLHYSFAEQHADLVANPVWGAFFAHGYEVDGRWVSDKPLPPRRIALALPPPWTGEVVLRHESTSGWWCSGEVRVVEFEGRLDLVSLELPLQASWRILRKGHVVERGAVRTSEVVFSNDEIVLIDESGTSPRFPISPAVWAAPSARDVESRLVTLPDFKELREYLARLEIQADALLRAPAPWPRVGLNMLIHELVRGPDVPPEALRARALAVLAAAGSRPPEQGLSADVARWTRRLEANDGSLGAATLEALVAASTRELRVNGRTVVSRSRAAKEDATVQLPVPRSGLAFVETFEEAFYANGGITAVEPHAAWVPLVPGRPVRVNGTVVGPAGLAPACVVVAWSGPPAEAPRWSLVRYAARSGPHAAGTAVRAESGPVSVLVESGTPGGYPRKLADYLPIMRGTATFTLDGHGALTGSFEETDRCGP